MSRWYFIHRVTYHNPENKYLKALTMKLDRKSLLSFLRYYNIYKIMQQACIYQNKNREERIEQRDKLMKLMASLFRRFLILHTEMLETMSAEFKKIEKYDNLRQDIGDICFNYEERKKRNMFIHYKIEVAALYHSLKYLDDNVYDQIGLKLYDFFLFVSQNELDLKEMIKILEEIEILYSF